MLSDDAIDDPPEEIEHMTERLSFWWSCGDCLEVHETEFDQRGEVVECPTCGTKAVLRGAY